MKCSEACRQIDFILGRIRNESDNLHQLTKDHADSAREQESETGNMVSASYDAGYAAGVEYARLMMQVLVNEISGVINEAEMLSDEPNE